MVKPPTRSARRVTMPPRLITAVSVVPPPISTTMLPTASSMGRSAPMAAAIGCSNNCASAAPARRVASVTARRSTSVIADGTQINTFGRANRETPARFNSSRIICSVVSKSVMAPPRNGRTATMKLGVRPIMSQASCPVANTSLVRRFLAITVGSFMMMPSPCL